jgi:hypothetical protein
VNAKRRLPVFQAPANDDVPERPPWQWSVFGAGLIVLLWMVLTLLASPLMRLIAASNVASTSLHFAIEGLASLLVGTVIGTWSKRRGIKEGATAGALSALFAALCGVAVGASSGALVWEDVWISLAGGVALVPSSTLAAALGAWIGSRKKRVLDAP